MTLRLPRGDVSGHSSERECLLIDRTGVKHILGISLHFLQRLSPAARKLTFPIREEAL
jgi:hypothetical protein